MGEKDSTKKGGMPKQNLNDTAFAICCLLVSCVCIPFLYYAYVIQKWGTEHAPRGYKYPQWSQLWMSGVGALFFVWMRQSIEWCLYPVVYRNCKPQKNEAIQEQYARKATRCFVQLVYFTMSAVWGYSILKDSTWLPWYLGGQNPKGSIEASCTLLFPPTPPGVHCYILFTYGYHVQDLIDHIFFKERSTDYREMLIHHIAALCLYPGFIFSNVMGLGTVIAWLHDLADITVALSRVLNCLGCDMLVTLAFPLMVGTWFYTRLVVLPIYIYHVFTEVRFPAPVEHFQAAVWLEMCFLCMMQVLHVFWFGNILQMAYNLIAKGERKEVVHRIEDDDDDATAKKQS